MLQIHFQISKISKLFYRIFPVILFLISPLFVTSAYTVDCSDIENPSPYIIACILGRFFNAAIYAVGAIFVATIAYGAWKASLALGNPKALQGARNTWTYAVFGLLVVLFAVVILNVMLSAFGLSLFNPNTTINLLAQGIENMLVALKITN